MKLLKRLTQDTEQNRTTAMFHLIAILSCTLLLYFAVTAKATIVNPTLIKQVLEK